MLLSQILGLIAFFFFLLSIQFQSKRRILEMQLLSNIFYTVSYSILKASSAVLVDCVSVLRCLIFYLYDKHGKKCPIFFLVFLIGLSLLVGFFTVKNVFDAIPIVISIIYIVTTYQNNLKIIQIGYIVSAVFWIIYNLHIGTYTPLIGNVFEMTSGIVAMIRMKRKKSV